MWSDARLKRGGACCPKEYENDRWRSAVTDPSAECPEAVVGTTTVAIPPIELYLSCLWNCIVRVDQLDMLDAVAQLAARLGGQRLFVIAQLSER